MADLTDLADALSNILTNENQSDENGSRRVGITDLRRLSGGASRETWSFDAVTPDGRRPLILQRLRGGQGLGGPSMSIEDGLLAAAARAGVPVPTVVADTAATAPFLEAARITAHIAGETLGPRIVRDERYEAARSHLAAQCAEALAAIHSIDPATAPGLESIDPLSRLRSGLDFLGESRPAFELALRWLAANRPAPGPPAVVHGDFRIGNLIVDESGLRAVLDWELAHLGDPLEDLAWLCVRAWRFGGAGEVGGVAPLADLLDAYRKASGRDVDPEAVRWWIVAGTLTWGLICVVQARRHLDGHIRSVELATIGRRVCETEYDLLQLLGIPARVDPQTVPPAETDTEPETGGLHGRPTAAELVEAVRGHLSEAVAPLLDGSAGFNLKVTGTALAIVERELTLGPAIEAAQVARLAGIGFADERTLAAAIRAGEVEGRDDQNEVAGVVRAAVVDRVRVANPRWLQAPDGPGATARTG